MKKQAQTTKQIQDATGILFVFTRADIQETASTQVPVNEMTEDAFWSAISEACQTLAPELVGYPRAMARVTVGRDDLGLSNITLEVAPDTGTDGSYTYIPEVEMDEIDEAARQLSIIHGIPKRKAAEKLIEIGVELGKLQPGARMKGLGDPRPCRQCGNPTRHKKGFCSPECCKASRAK